MSDGEPTPKRRGRGRPAGGDAAATRRGILNAARGQFAQKGFRGASVRAIAREAGVDPSLVHHHFGDKSQLLVASMEIPFNPLEKIGQVVAGPIDGLAERLVRTFCSSWDPHQDVFNAIARSTLGGGLENPPMMELVRDLIVTRFAERIEGPDARLRAGLIASQLVGLAMIRYVIRVEPVAGASVDDLVAQYAPAIDAILSQHDTPG